MQKVTGLPGRRVPEERDGKGPAEVQTGTESICKLSASLSTIFLSTVINFAVSLGWFECGECK